MCPICKKKALFETVETWQEYTLRRCLSCDVVFSDPLKNPGASWYENSEMYAVGRYLHVRLAWPHLQFLDEMPKGRTLLDVGCGTGIFLHEAEKKGYQPWGLDFSREDIKVGQGRFGLKNLFAMGIEGFSKKNKSKRFDIISFFEVIEHMDQPADFLSKVKKLLKPGGLIVLSTPNRDRSLDTLAEGDYPPNHLTRWNEKSLRAFLERQGFEVVTVVTKKFEWDEVAAFIKAKIKFGIARRMAKRGLDNQDQGTVQQAAKLMRIKDFIAKAIALPVALVLKLLPMQGTGLFCIARVPLK